MGFDGKEIKARAVSWFSKQERQQLCFKLTALTFLPQCFLLKAYLIVTTSGSSKEH